MGIIQKRDGGHIKGLLEIAAVLLVIVAVLCWLNGGDPDPTDKGYYVVVSGSMDGDDTGYPVGSIPVGSLIVVQELSDDEIAASLPGDVLAYSSGSAVVSHRVISVDAESRTVTVKGDVNTSSETVPFDIVVGKVVAVHPWIGKALVLLTNRAAYVIAELVCAITAASCIRDIRRIVREERRNGNEHAESTI